jgi:hypothetical protein
MTMSEPPTDDALGAIAAYEHDHDHEHQPTSAECRHPECEESGFRLGWCESHWLATIQGMDR